MKKHILTILMLASVSAFALPNEIKKTEKPSGEAAAVVADTNPMVSLSQLQQENAMLKSQMMAIINENEELKSKLAYETVMRNMFVSMNENKQKENLAELNATLQYNQLMANMLLTLKRK